MLTEGFLRGWLTFEKKTPLSRLREEFILAQIERGIFQEVLGVKSSTDASIASGFPSDGSLKVAIGTFTKFMGLALPYVAKDSKLDTSVTKEKMAEWKATLKALREERARKKK